MEFVKEQHRRRSVRLKNYDYSMPGRYFITVCTNNRECLFGKIIGNEMVLNQNGSVVERIWNDLPNRYNDVYLDSFVIMPNHIHGIIEIAGSNGFVGAIHDGSVSVGAIHGLDDPVGAIHGLDDPVGAIHELPLQKTSQRRQMLLPKIIGYFKMNSAKRINLVLDSAGIPIWQRNYYEHIIRNDDECNRIHLYIESNIDNWEDDDENLDKRS